jgi:hypothetical protein
MQAPQENPYNGGLIDFHENALRADLGAALYAHQLAAAQAQYSAAVQQPQYPGLAQAPQYPLQAHPHPQQPAVYAPPAPQYQAPYPPGQPTPVQSMVMSQAPGQCIAGPPAFLHLHGKVYAPVEESAPATPEPSALKEAAAPSSKSLDRLVEKRVEERVNEFFAKSGKSKGLGASIRKKNQPKEDATTLKQLNSQMRARLSAY